MADQVTSRGAGAAGRRVMVVQDGARLHYAIPLAFQKAGVLHRVFAGWYSEPGTLSSGLAKIARMINRPIGQRMLDHHAAGLDYSKVVQFRWHALAERRARKRFTSDRAYFGWASEEFARQVRQYGWRGADTLFGFIRNVHPDLCRAARVAELLTVGDQIIAPYEVELAEERLQSERFPGWSSVPLSDPRESWTDFERATWEQLDHITCASNYVRDGLMQQGIDAARISVLPYPIDAAEFPLQDRKGRSGPMVVGFVGAVGLRKGTPYFVETAKKLAARGSGRVRFVMIGPVHLSQAVQAEIRQHVELVGAVPRSEVRGWLEKFDVYFFPSTCEGSAGSVMEAMATGLPIVTSPNAGSIVEHGMSGFIAPYADTDAFAGFLERLAGNENERLEMGRAARKAAESCSIEAYSEQWKLLLARLASPVKAANSAIRQS